VDLEGKHESAIKVVNDGVTAKITSAGGEVHTFIFDKAFASHATQEDVFQDVE
jgi:hypothetical protein